MRNPGLDEAQAGIKIAGRNINNLRYADNTILMAESQEELKSLLMKVKEESEKVVLKLNIQKTKIMTSGPSLHGKQMRKQWKQCQTLFFGTPKSLQMVIAGMKLKDAYPLEERLWPTQTTLKSSDITLETKVCLVKAMFSTVVMYGCESCTIKKAER